MPIRFLLAFTTALWALPCFAQAVEDDVVVVIVEDPASLLDSAQVRADVERDLGVPTVDASATGEHTTMASLHIRITSSGAAQIDFALGDTRRRRSVELPADRDEALRVVVLIGANLVREESADLLARMARATDVGAEEGSTPLDAGAAATQSAAPATLADSDAASDEVSAVVEEPAVDEESTEPEPSPWLRESTQEYPGRFAITHRGGAAARDGQAVGFFIWGLEFGYALHPMFTLGVTDLTVSGGYSSLQGTIFSGSGTVFAELGGFVDPRIQFYGRLGLAMQGRLNPPPPAGAFQMAISIGAGARLFATRRLFFAFEIDANVILTDSYAMGTGSSVDLPQGSTPASGSIAVGWQF